MNIKIKLFLTAITLLFTSFAFAEQGLLEPTQNPEAAFRLYNTQNIYTLLKLDTRTGQIWQVQWGESANRFTSPLNEKAIVSDGKPGRFSLYPTGNIHTFILIDQVMGITWHVQWGSEEQRFIYRIK